jgi:arylsulfatase A-like enzyme
MLSLNLLIGAAAATGATPPRPNILYIFADDLGWGAGQFNNPDSPIATPNLDALAQQGLNFTRHYAATVCSPSRNMLYTGFHTGHGSNDRNANIDSGLRPQEVTVGEVLRSAGYATSVWGKWGWGGSQSKDATDLRASPWVLRPATLPSRRGFDTFYGYLNHTRAHSYFVDSLWTTSQPFPANKYHPTADHGLWLERTGNTAETPHAAYTHDLVAAKAEAYIASRAGQPDPFLMMVCFTTPHQRLDHIAELPNGLAQYANHPTMSQREKEHAAMVTRMDASIGALIARLDDPNADGDSADSLLANTLIMFSSDNGPTPETGLDKSGLINLDLTNGLRGGKRDLYEGGIRTPLLVRWDAAISAQRRGTKLSRPTDLSDFIATAADLAGTAPPLGIDGVSLAPTITNHGVQRERLPLVSENFEVSQTANPNADWSIIDGDHKLIKSRSGKFELYDLAKDPAEQAPLDLALEANRLRKQQLESIALAEGAGQPDDYAVQYANWIGADGGDLMDAGNWNLKAQPRPNWTVVIGNAAETPSTVIATSAVSTLALEVRGESSPQTLLIDKGREVNGRNEVRISPGGRLLLVGGRVGSARWIDVLAGGELVGNGAARGDLFCAGLVSPGDETLGRIEVEGDVHLLPDAIVRIGLGHESNDQLTASGAVHLDGTLKLSLEEGESHKARQMYEVLSGESVTGKFRKVDAPPLPGNDQLRLRYLPDRVQVIVERHPR